MADIVLSTLNARFIHTAFGLRYLYANLHELQGSCELLEFNIKQRPVDIAEKLLQQQPQIIGFGVYIWNVSEISLLLAILKQVAPHIVIVLGGPEVSHPPDLPELAGLADYIITGGGEISFPVLCRQLLSGERPEQKIISGVSAALSELVSPYPFYIYGPKLALLSWQPEPRVIIIDDQRFSDSARKLFDIAWNTGKQIVRGDKK